MFCGSLAKSKLGFRRQTGDGYSLLIDLSRGLVCQDEPWQEMLRQSQQQPSRFQ